ncbi:MAG: colanic acid biosynthesis acetyltransferase WcaF [Sphingobacteriaceae bacterium]|nr:colanic acid biosynthesis acetyltransferase WcaF [Sphingobacteriaceae bacterium]
MEALKTNLATFNNKWYKPGSILKRALWYLTSVTFFKSSFPFYNIKRFLLRLFGAYVGKNVIIKPHVTIKYPWKLHLGDYVWIGEYAWIDNLAKVTLKNNSCVSQGALLLCGNHNYKKTTFDLIIGEITLEEGAWAGAKTVICPGVKLGSHSLLTVGSIATSNLEAYWIYQGNPATKLKPRIIKS